MRYRLSDGSVVRSENAAKSFSQRSIYLTELLKRRPVVATALDFGCGKLRYLDALLEIAEEVTVTDSDIQLGRTQRLLGEVASIVKLARKSNRWTAMGLRDVYAGKKQFDRVLIANVLQIIPMISVREGILKRLKNLITKDGEIIVVVQYRNSDFSRIRERTTTEFYLDGFLTRHPRGVSFYALISPPNLTAMLNRCGLEVRSCKLHDGSCYVIAGLPTRPLHSAAGT